MFNKKIVIYLIIIMFSFLKTSMSENSKTFYDFKINSINGEELNLSIFKDKTILLVNVASKCGFTKQYDDLQKLYDDYKERGLVVIGIPSNQFGSQEPGSEAEIKEICSTKFGVSFPMYSKIDVNGPNRHPIYNDIIGENGPLKGNIKWNFGKILVGKDGNPIDRFGSMTSPSSKKLIKAIEEALQG